MYTSVYGNMPHEMVSYFKFLFFIFWRGVGGGGGWGNYTDNLQQFILDYIEVNIHKV